MQRHMTTLENCITINQAKQLFRRTEMTIYLWRRDKGMPYIQLPGGKLKSVRFDVDKILKWAKTLNIRYEQDQLDVIRKNNNQFTSIN